MDKIFGPLYWLFGICMSFLLGILNDQYFLAITIFVILTRVILIPFNMKQQKTTAKSSRIQPKIAKIQKKYANTGNQSQKQTMDNRNKMNEEMQALYARENHNPMNMGCGPMLFQMVFLFGIIGIIYQPLTYVLKVSATDLAAMKTALEGILGGSQAGLYPELKILSNVDALSAQLSGQISAGVFEGIQKFKEGMMIFGFDLTQFPNIKEFNTLILVPVLSGLTSLLSSLFSMKVQKKNNPAMAEQNKMMNYTMLLMPLFSVYIAFKVPAAVGVYWAISNVISTLQQILLNTAYPPKKIVAKSMIESTIERRSREHHIRSMQKTA